MNLSISVHLPWDNLNDKCHATFGTSKCKRAAGIEEDAYNYTNLDSLRWEDYILPVQGGAKK